MTQTQHEDFDAEGVEHEDTGLAVETADGAEAPEDAGANRPVRQFRYGAVKAAVWENATDNGTMYGVTFNRSYRDSRGEWHDTGSFNPADLPALSKAALDAHSFVYERMREIRREVVHSDAGRASRNGQRVLANGRSGSSR